MQPKQILMPYLGSDADKDLLQAVCRLAQAWKAKLELVHVIEVPMALPVDAPDLPGTDAANLILDQGEDAAADAGVEVETELLTARDAGHAIVEEAIAREADLVFMEGRQRVRLGMLTLGRTADYVLKHAPCTVWISRAALSHTAED